MATTVAVLNSSDDVVELLRFVLEQAGFKTVAVHLPDIKRGQEDFLAFLTKYDPAVIVYDIAPPYRDNWTFLQLILSSEAMKKRRFVFTTANKQLLQEIVGQTLDAFEISEKPYALNSIVEAVKRS